MITCANISDRLLNFTQFGTKTDKMFPRNSSTHMLRNVKGIEKYSKFC